MNSGSYLNPLQSIPVLYTTARQGLRPLTARNTLNCVGLLISVLCITNARDSRVAVALKGPNQGVLEDPKQAQESPNGREGQQSAQLRPLAISLICGMAHSTQRTRAELWAHNGLELLLGLLQEQVHCTPYLPLPWRHAQEDYPYNIPLVDIWHGLLWVC